MVRIVAASILCLASFLCAAPFARAGTDQAAFAQNLKNGGLARAEQVSDDGSLMLADGRVVRLLCIHIPNDQSLRRAAVKALDRLAAGRSVTLWFDARTTDRYGHLLAQVVTGEGVWLEAALIGRGLAAVESRRDDHAMVPSLLAEETKARDRGLGLWSDPARRVLSADRIADTPKGHLNRFGIVEGRVADVSDSTNWTFVNFGADWHTDFTIAVAAGDRRGIQADGLDLAGLAGKRVRVRGWIRDWNGPLIEVDHAAQIEIVPEPSTLAEQEISQ